MKKIMITIVLIAISFLSEAAAPVSKQCFTKDLRGRSFFLEMKGIESLVPGTNKYKFNVTINIKATLPEGTFQLTNQAYEGLKTIYYTLEQYNISLPIKFANYTQLAVGINNKNTSTANFFDQNGDGSELKITCN